MTLAPPLLQRMIDTGRTQVDGEPRELHSQIPRAYAETLQRVVRERRPTTSLEVGLAFGVSALAILGAGEGDLVSVDPLQADYDHHGARAIEAAGLADRHRLVPDFDYLALPALLREGLRVQLAYIDGWHTFDYTLLDFFYADKMLDVGGVVVFNDCGWPAIHRVTRFVTSHRSYRELDVDLPRDYGPGRVAAARRRLEGRSDADRYFEKVDDAEPRWDFFARF
jgi:predicted O-methyltransferase YrrM